MNWAVAVWPTSTSHRFSPPIRLVGVPFVGDPLWSPQRCFPNRPKRSGPVTINRRRAERPDDHIGVWLVLYNLPLTAQRAPVLNREKFFRAFMSPIARAAPNAITLGEKKLKISMLSAVALVFVTCSAPAGAQTGDLKVRFQYGGDSIPDQSAINATADAAYCGKQDLKDEALIVNPDNQGIKNVILAVYTGRGGSKLDPVEPPKNELVLANKSCRFEPHVVIAQAGDTLRITNPDPIGHNANVGFFENDAINPLVPPGGEVSVELKSPERGMVPVTCNIHPWMKATLVVLDHPYAGVTDENGEVVIKGIPVGTHVFRANHENNRIGKVTVDGKEQEWRAGRFEVEIEPGMNELSVVLPAEMFSN